MNKMLSLCLLVVFSIACDRKNAERTEDLAPAEITSHAKEVVTLLASENFEKATQYFDDTMKKGLPPAKLREVWSNVTSRIGPFQRQAELRSETSEGFSIIFVTSEFENASLDIKLVFNESGHIAGLFFVPQE